MFYKFGKNDIFHNRIKAHPRVNFKVYNQQIFYNNKQDISGTFENRSTAGYVDLYEFMHPPYTSYVKPYPFIIKDGSLTSFKTVSLNSFNSDFVYGDTITGSYPLTASISVDRFVEGADRNIIDALKNTLNYYKPYSNHYSFSSSLGNKGSQEIKIISIPSIFYGSSIDKGTVSLRFYVTGILAAELVDDTKRGELRQILPEDSNSGSVAGVVLYNEGFIILTSSWSIHPTHTEYYDIYSPGTASSPRWLDFGTTGSTTPADLTNVASSSFEIDFLGTQYVSVLTMLAHAPKGELNYSSNPTFIEYGQSGTLQAITNSVEYKEFANVSLKNIVKSNFDAPTASFENVTYISRIGIYDKDKNLIAIAKLANPVRKREIDNFTFKLKMDF